MEWPSELKSKTPEALEAWFLSALSAEALPVADLLAALGHLAEGGETTRAEEWAELLQEVLAERGDRAGMLALCAGRSAWRDADPAFRRACEEALAAVFKERPGPALLRSAGFDREVPLGECLRRLGVLMRLQPDTMCRDKTWGFGVVRAVDGFYQKISIDFAKRPGHQMSLAYAGEALELLDEDHLLVRRHRDPQALRTLARERPAELVKLALQSHGPASAARLKEILCDGILPEEEWKPFWEAARKTLKADPLVEMPAGRSDPLRLLSRPKEYADAWYAAFAREKDPEAVLLKLDELGRETKLTALPEERRRALGERLAFAMWVSGRSRPGVTARLALAAVAAGLTDLAGRDEPAGERAAGEQAALPRGVGDVLEWLLAPDVLIKALAELPARDVDPFLAALIAHSPERAGDTLVRLVDRLPASVLSAAVDRLTAGGREEQCVRRFAEGLQSRSASGEMLYWLCSHPETVEAWDALDLPQLAIQTAEELDLVHARERRRLHRQLYDLYGDRKWMGHVLELMDAVQRETLLARIHASRSWPEGPKRTVLASMIRLYPELGPALTAIEEGVREPPREVRLTSWRTYGERRDQLKELVEKTIPENSREIAEARSYGDLRENFEYQAARDRQRLLIRRKHELERDLAAVRGSDFSGIAADAAGTGTCVALGHADGRVERVCILGEWDRDEALGIIANRSALARALEGRRAGDEVRVPTAAGEATVRIVEVGVLPDEIRAWLAGGGPAAKP